jgi:hypothetical protein
VTRFWKKKKEFRQKVGSGQCLGAYPIMYELSQQWTRHDYLQCFFFLFFSFLFRVGGFQFFDLVTKLANVNKKI